MSFRHPFNLTDPAIAQTNRWFKCQIAEWNMPVSSDSTSLGPNPLWLQHLRLVRPVLKRNPAVWITSGLKSTTLFSEMTQRV